MRGDPPNKILLSRHDPLLALTWPEALAAINTYEAEIGIYYPPVELDGLLWQLSNFLKSLEAPRDHSPAAFQTPWFDDCDIAIAKVIMACGLEVEDERTRSSELYQSTNKTIELAVTDQSPTIKHVTLLSLAVGRFRKTPGSKSEREGFADILSSLSTISSEKTSS